MNPQPPPPPLPRDLPLAINASKTHVVRTFTIDDVRLTTCRIDPTGTWVVAAAENFHVYRWPLAGPQSARTILHGHNSWVRSFDFSTDGNWLYSGGYDDRIGIWPLSEPRPSPQRMLVAHDGWVRWIRTSPDGRLLASCGNDNLLKLWDTRTWELVHVFKGHQRYPYAVVFHPDGKRLASFDLMGVIKEWEIKSGKVTRQWEAKFMWGFDQKFRADMGGARDMRFSPDGKYLAVAGLTEVTNAFGGVHKPMVLLMDWESGEFKKKLKIDSRGMAWGIRFHPEGFLVGAGAIDATTNRSKGVLWFWNLDDDKPFHTFKLTGGGRALDLTPDGRQAAVAQTDRKLQIVQFTAKTA
jgi:WD40 repeat protein